MTTKLASIRSRFAPLLFVLGVPALAAFGCHHAVVVSTAPPAPSSAAPVASAAPPPVDTDGDGIPDVDDKCPTEKGVIHEKHPERNGCPHSGRVRIGDTRVEISEKIMFASGAATIATSSESLLGEIAQLLAGEGKHIDLIEVAGHADRQGDAAYNLKLTQQRAVAVVDALVKLGIPAAKLRAKGYGSYCPLDAGDDEKNRRVEFVIVKMRGKATGTPLGCDAAVKAGVKPDAVN
jgi:outer membrane protein OmpA-like peptidoglycan-associated protein